MVFKFVQIVSLKENLTLFYMTYIIWYALSLIAFVAILFVIKSPKNRKIAGYVVYLGSIIPSAYYLSRYLFDSDYLYLILMSFGLIVFALLLAYLFKGFRKSFQ